MAGERALPGLGLTGFWDYGSDLWDTGMNENLRRLSVLCQGAVLDSVASEPATPADGDIYLLTGGANANSLAVRDNGVWVYYAPSAGWLIYDRTAGQFLQFDGTSWSQLSAAGSGGGGGGGTVQGEALPFARTSPIDNASSWSSRGVTPPATVSVVQDDAKGIFGFYTTGATVGAQPIRYENPGKRPVLGADFDHVFLVDAITSGNFPWAGGIFVEDNATQKLVAFGVMSNGEFYRWRWTNTTFNDETAIDGSMSLSSGAWPVKYYLRLKRVGTVLEVHVSGDGLGWVKIHDETIGDHLPDIDRTGLFFNPYGQGADDLSSIYVLGHDSNGPQGRATSGTAGTALAEQLADYTITDADLSGGMVIEMNVSAANTVTVPAGLGGSEPVTVVQAGTGQTSIVAGAGVSILSADGALKLRAQYSSATLIPKGADTYYLVGDLTA